MRCIGKSLLRQNFFCTFPSILQLRLLQERMSTALQVYYRLRGLYGSDVVAEFKDESKISSNRMDELKAEMGEALGKIDSFLRVFAQTA